MKLRLFRLAVLLLTSLGSMECGQAAKDMTKLQDVRWPSPPVRIDLLPICASRARLEFSSDGRYICAWWLPTVPGDYTRVAVTNAVFNLQGERITEATDKAGQLVGQYAVKFPAIAWRRRFADFVKNGAGYRTTIWGFKEDYSVGIRFLKPTKSEYALGTVECWRFEPSEKKQWSVPLPERSSDSGLAVFFKWEGQPSVMIAFDFAQASILSEEDGKVLGSFTCGKPDTKGDPMDRDDAEALAYKRKFHLGGDTGDWRFSVCELAFDPVKKLLACGDGVKSPRFRIDSIGPPHRIVFEANWDQHPRRPRGGEWTVSSMHFDAAGKYLVVGYEFEGRLTSKYYTPVEVFDTASWKIVWFVNNPEIPSDTSPRISPDGKTMALTRAHWLEIGPFQPSFRQK
jgi:hypothetical protein